MRSFSRVSLTVSAFILSAACLSCQKAKAESKPAPVQQAEPEVKEPADFQKITSVYGKMSERFRNEIPLSQLKTEAFTTALNEALAFEAGTTNNDIGLFYLIDKKHNIGSDYVPSELIPVKQCSLFNVSRNDLSLRSEAYHALCTLSEAAMASGIKLMVSSTYRSYDYQKNLFARYVKQDGEELAERYSARPGTSQHQLGVAVDFGSITDDWGDTKMGKWVYDQAARYGWSLSFPKGYEDVTGYMWECWHFRYIGVQACNLQKDYFNNIQQYMLEFIDEWKK